jgi:hypothetical protein
MLTDKVIQAAKPKARPYIATLALGSNHVTRALNPRRDWLNTST